MSTATIHFLSKLFLAEILRCKITKFVKKWNGLSNFWQNNIETSTTELFLMSLSTDVGLECTVSKAQVYFYCEFHLDEAFC